MVPASSSNTVIVGEYAQVVAGSYRWSKQHYKAEYGG
jgi:hypothetical protein